jgi:hypothetical protein
MNQAGIAAQAQCMALFRQAWSYQWSPHPISIEPSGIKRCIGFVEFRLGIDLF